MDAYFAKPTAFRDQCEKAIGGVDIKICIENADGYLGIPLRTVGMVKKATSDIRDERQKPNPAGGCPLFK